LNRSNVFSDADFRDFDFYDAKGSEIRWRWYDLAVELSCAGIMIVADCREESDSDKGG